MSGKFLAMIVFVYVLLAFLGATFEGQTSMMGTSAQADIQTMGNLAQGSQTLPFFGILSIPVQVPGWVASAYRIVTLQFSFLMTGGAIMFYYVFLLPIAVAGVTSFIMLFLGMIRGNISWG
jgi:hypothetical protein